MVSKGHVIIIGLQSHQIGLGLVRLRLGLNVWVGSGSCQGYG